MPHATMPDAINAATVQPTGAQTAASQIYRALRDSILTMQLAPGATLSEQETAARLGVSRTPVREAFIRLSREKMLIVSPQRRTAVARIDLDRVRQEQFLREAIEIAVAEQFLRLARGEDYDALEACLSQQRAALALADFPAFLRHDDAFHHRLYAATGNDLAAQAVRRNCFDYQRLRSLSAADAPTQRLNLTQHEALLSLLRRGDLAAAQGLLREHLRRLFEEIPAMREQHPAYFA